MRLHTNTHSSMPDLFSLSHSQSHKRQTGLSALLMMLSDSGFVGVSGRQGQIGHSIDVSLYT